MRDARVPRSAVTAAYASASAVDLSSLSRAANNEKMRRDASQYPGNGD